MSLAGKPPCGLRRTWNKFPRVSQTSAKESPPWKRDNKAPRNTQPQKVPASCQEFAPPRFTALGRRSRRLCRRVRRWMKLVTPVGRREIDPRIVLHDPGGACRSAVLPMDDWMCRAGPGSRPRCPGRWRGRASVGESAGARSPGLWRLGGAAGPGCTKPMLSASARPSFSIDLWLTGVGLQAS